MLPTQINNAILQQNFWTLKTGIVGTIISNAGNSFVNFLIDKNLSKLNGGNKNVYKFYKHLEVSVVDLKPFTIKLEKMLSDYSQSIEISAMNDLSQSNFKYKGLITNSIIEYLKDPNHNLNNPHTLTTMLQICDMINRHKMEETSDFLFDWLKENLEIANGNLSQEQNNCFAKVLRTFFPLQKKNFITNLFWESLWEGSQIKWWAIAFLGIVHQNISNILNITDSHSGSKISNLGLLYQRFGDLTFWVLQPLWNQKPKVLGYVLKKRTPLNQQIINNFLSFLQGEALEKFQEATKPITL